MGGVGLEIPLNVKIEQRQSTKSGSSHRFVVWITVAYCTVKALKRSIYCNILVRILTPKGSYIRDKIKKKKLCYKMFHGAHISRLAWTIINLRVNWLLVRPIQAWYLYFLQNFYSIKEIHALAMFNNYVCSHRHFLIVMPFDYEFEYSCWYTIVLHCLAVGQNLCSLLRVWNIIPYDDDCLPIDFGFVGWLNWWWNAPLSLYINLIKWKQPKGWPYESVVLLHHLLLMLLLPLIDLVMTILLSRNMKYIEVFII